MNGLTGLMSSKDHDWETPQVLFDSLNAEFGPFDLDPCCVPETAKCPRYFTPDEDGLAQTWEGRVFVNPPYGREIGKWVRKAWEEAQRGAMVVLLIPARTDTAYWHDYCFRGEVRFLRGRIYGSGTTLAACAKLGIPGTGIELELKYVEMAAARLSEDLSYGEPNLFNRELEE